MAQKFPPGRPDRAGIRRFADDAALCRADNEGMNTNKAAGLVAAGVGVGVGLYTLFVRPWHLRWGATAAETQESLPGDEFVANCKARATHAITINAPVAEVWPWLMQIGQDKGGFYSYAWLENLVGCHLHNADRILPQFQSLQVGDSVRLHPAAPPLPVLLVEPECALVLGSNTGDAGTWAFYLRPLDRNSTRLIIRCRGDVQPGILPWLLQYVLFEPAHFIMERKMMLGIKARAEGREGCG